MIAYAPDLARHLAVLQRLKQELPLWPFEPVALRELRVVVRLADGSTCRIPVFNLVRRRIAELFELSPDALRRDFPAADGRSWCAHRAAEGIVVACAARGRRDSSAMEKS